jgi:hypothetical protein
MVMRRKALAIASGFLAGGFLFLRFGWAKNGTLFGWEWYLGAALLEGIGVPGIFSEDQLSAAIGLGVAPTLIESVEIYLHPYMSFWPIVLPLIFLFTFPAPLMGYGISRLLKRSQLPWMVYLVPLTGALAIGALLPNIQNTQRQTLETKTVPGLVRQIYSAEMLYSAHRTDGAFACDGTLLPGAVGNLGWVQNGVLTNKKYLIIQHYTISLDCPNETTPRSFGVKAFLNDGHLPGASYSMDQTGKLVVEPPPQKGPNTH